MNEVASESIARVRFDLLLMTSFACAALLLSGLGVYGLMATLAPLERHAPVGAWVIDDTGMPKKGRKSVGVARQWLGSERWQTQARTAPTARRDTVHRHRVATTPQQP